MKTIRLAGALLLVVVSAACGVPKYLVEDSLLASTVGGSRSDKTIIVPTAQVQVGNNKKENLYDYVVRLCDLDANGAESNCKDSVVLPYVLANSLY